VADTGRARIIAATGASQFEFLAALVGTPGVPWNEVEMFHLDEYIGLPIEHPASFRRYLRERLIEPSGIRTAHLLDGEQDPHEVCAEVGARIAAAPVDVAFVGIGENGTWPSTTRRPTSRRATRTSSCRSTTRAGGSRWGRAGSGISRPVPRQAISMSCRQILAARRILCIVPDARKAAAVKAAVKGP
jgi:glucosamine-6-phosphate deaminase